MDYTDSIHKNHNITAFNTLLKLPASHSSLQTKIHTSKKTKLCTLFYNHSYVFSFAQSERQKPQTRNMPSLLKRVVIYYITSWTTQTWGMQFILSTITIAKTSKRETKSISINSKQSAAWKRKKRGTRRRRYDYLYIDYTTGRMTTDDTNIHSTLTLTPLRYGWGICRPALLRADTARLLGLCAEALSLSSEQQLSAMLRGSSSSSIRELSPFSMSSSSSSCCCRWIGMALAQECRIRHKYMGTVTNYHGSIFCCWPHSYTSKVIQHALGRWGHITPTAKWQSLPHLKQALYQSTTPWQEGWNGEWRGGGGLKCIANHIHHKYNYQLETHF